MSAYIVFNNGSEKRWNVGTPHTWSEAAIKDVVEVQADGDELLHIRTRAQNFPTPNENLVVRWFGDHAKFIVANLL